MRDRDAVVVLLLFWLLWPGPVEETSVVLDWPREWY